MASWRKTMESVQIMIMEKHHHLPSLLIPHYLIPHYLIPHYLIPPFHIPPFHITSFHIFSNLICTLPHSHISQIPHYLTSNYLIPYYLIPHSPHQSMQSLYHITPLMNTLSTPPPPPLCTHIRLYQYHRASIRIEYSGNV